MEKKLKKRVLVAMSGGVDSAVVAALLKKQGYDCIAVHLKFWVDSVSSCAGKKVENKCCTAESVADARNVAKKLGIPFHVIDVSVPFYKHVVGHYLNEYSAGRCPNPCIECNRNIKFGDLFGYAKKFKADYIATGHYVKNKFNKKTGTHELWVAKDREKDQSYFLYHLSQKKLAKVLFPLGNLLKKETYELAKKFKLPAVVEKKESQGLCFFSENAPNEFLRRYLANKYLSSGGIFTIDGRRIGEHKGLPFYTIGQRQGLGIGGIKGECEGEGWYVVQIDRKKNALIVGRKDDIFTLTLKCSKLDFISGEIPKKPVKVFVRIRHRGALVPATLKIKNGKGFVVAEKPLAAVSPGQAVVFYEGKKVLGGGEIGDEDGF